MDDRIGAPHNDVTAPGAFGPGWGELGPGWTRTVPRPPARHRRWSTVLLVLHTIAVVVGVAVLVFGAAVVVGDMTAPTPEEGRSPEAWGSVAGFIYGVGGVCVLIPAAILRSLTRRGRREADQGSPRMLRGVAITTLVIAGVGLAPSLIAGDPSSHVVWFVLGGSYAVPAVLLLVTMRSPRAQQTYGSPRGAALSHD